MAEHCVLIVDDQRDVRRVLSAGLETLGLDLQVIDLPSGEEALLVLSSQKVDLLVTDVRLPGISGLELYERARQRNPGVDLILITGLSDPGVRQRIESAEVAAFFYKPVEMAEFLDTVKACLERPKPDRQQASRPEEGDRSLQAQVEPPNLADELANLRQHLNANAVLLLDERGRCVAQAGEIPDMMNGGTLVAASLAAAQAGAEISGYLGMLLPESFSIFRGLQTDFILAHVGLTATLLISLPAGFTPRTLGERLIMVDQSVHQLLEILQAGSESQVLLKEPELPAETAEDTAEDEEPVLDELFNLAGQENYKPEEVDAFWNSLVEDDNAEGVINANAISYDQARQLGLAPDQEGE